MPWRKMQKIKYSFKKVLTGSDLSSRRLAIMEASSGNAGPLVWVTAALHGDEVGGIVIIQEVFKLLRKHPLLRGTLRALPLMNPIGFESGTRRIPVTEEDLNRSFPGDKNGRLSERIADNIFQLLTAERPSLVLDLHNDWTKSVPYLLLDPNPGPKYKAVYEETKKYARETGFLMIEEESEDPHEINRTLSGSLVQAHIPAFTLELGESYVVNENNVRNGVTAVWRILVALGMVEPNDFANLSFDVPKEVHGKFLRYSDRPHAQTSGIARFSVEPGQMVKRGDVIARVYNVFGKLQETVRAQADGIVLGYSDYSVAFPGVPLVAFGTIR